VVAFFCAITVYAVTIVVLAFALRNHSFKDLPRKIKAILILYVVICTIGIYFFAMRLLQNDWTDFLDEKDAEI